MKRTSFLNLKLNLALCLLAFGLTNGFAQKQTLFVYDVFTKAPLSQVLILDKNNSLLGETNDSGHAFIRLEKLDSPISFRLFGYETLGLNLNQLFNNNFRVALRPSIEELGSIELSSKKRKVEILYSHFELWDNGIIAVTKNKKQLIVFNTQQKPLYTLDIPTRDKDKLNTLFKDAANRIYLIGDNSVLQLQITTTKLYHFKSRTINDFNKYIRNLKLITPDGAHIYRDLERVNYTMPTTLLKEYTFFNTNISYPKYHNCGTDFIAYRLGENPKVIFSTIDTNSYYAAGREFFKYVNGYIYAQGSVLDRRWGMQQHSYNTLFSRLKSLPLFNYNNKILVVDVFNNRLLHLNANHQKDTAVYFDLSKSTNNFVALQDMDNQRIWLFERQKYGRDYLFEIKEGLQKSDEGVFIDAFSRNVRIKNNWVYFLNEKYQIIRLPVDPDLTIAQ